MIVITAPTGLIGHQVLENLLDSGEPLRVIARDPPAFPRTPGSTSRSSRARMATPPSWTRHSPAPTPCSG